MNRPHSHRNLLWSGHWPVVFHKQTGTLLYSLFVSWSFYWQSNGRVDGFTMCTLSDAYVTQIIKEVKCKENTNPERQERLKVKKHICPLTSISDLINIQDLDKIYLVGISVDDMEKELQKIKTVQK